jgi:hypothetical protein
MNPLRQARLLLWLVGLTAADARAASPLVDAPVCWYDADAFDIPAPAVRDPNALRDGIHVTVVRPVDRATRLSSFVRDLGGDRYPPARDVNALDEALNSTWFTNRIGLFAMSPVEVARGPGEGQGPDRSGPWTVVSAKSEGVTPGFDIQDARGVVYLIKFDPPGYPGLATGADAIVARLFHAAGYNVPEDAVVTFRREDLLLGSRVQIREGGRKRAMTEHDIDALLARVDTVAAGEYRAISSRFLPGRPEGPFNWYGRRGDDPNDRVDHEDRRELRGLRLFAAWVNHFDLKQQNTLDMWVEENGRHFLRHHLIDFASTLGAGATGPIAIQGHEYVFDLPQILARLGALGFYEDDWRRLRVPAGLPEVGYFEADLFDPLGFKPTLPNTALAQMTDRDGYWAAKIISAFTDAHLAAVCETAHYPHPQAAQLVAEILAKRRDVIAREWFTRVTPIDFFGVVDGDLVAHDLGVERGLWPAASTRYRVRSYAVDEQGRPMQSAAWREAANLTFAIFEDDAPACVFRAVEIQVDRGEGWSRSVTVYVAEPSRRVVGVER